MSEMNQTFEAAATLRAQATPRPLKPMPLWQSLLFFGVPAIIAALDHHVLWPWLVSLGLSEENGWHCAYLIWFVGLFVAALVAYTLEGNSLRWRSFRERYRLGPLKWREWGWTLGGILVFAALAYASNSLALTVFDRLGFVPPDLAPSGPVTNVPLYLVTLLLNVLSEELWWRGYILPRQELTHGRYTWLVHGVLWACFHAYKWWAVPFMLITTWIVPFIAQRLKNTTPGIVSHLITNGLGALPIVISLLSK